MDQILGSKHYKVAIIGAGVAGLAAANTLNELGCKDFIILEAQEKVGGRINTVTWQNHVLELGAQFIHGEQNPIFELAKRHDMLSDQKTEEGQGLYIRDDGAIIDHDLVKIVNFKIGEILGECEKFVNFTTDFPASVEDFLRLQFLDYLKNCDDSEDIKEIKSELLEWHILFQNIDNSCLNLRQLSAKYWGQYTCFDDEAHVNFKKGCSYGAFVQLLCENLPKDTLSLSTAVTEVQYGSKSIQLTCLDGSVIFCDHVIITVSLGVLKKGLKIIPSFPNEISSSINDIGFYGIGKIFLVFEDKWWDAEGFQLIWRKSTKLDEKDEWLRGIQGFDPILNEPNVLLGWVGGSALPIMESLSEEEVGIGCMKLLRRFIRDRVIPEPIKVFRTKWLSNPWVQGAYCHLTPEGDDSISPIEKLRSPIFFEGELKILFAGEAVHPSHYSTVHGAYESGQEQARLLFNTFQTSSKL